MNSQLELAYCKCLPNYYYENQSQMCTFLTDSMAHWIKDLPSLNKNNINDDRDHLDEAVHFSESIISWILLMFLLTMIFVILTVLRKCFYSFRYQSDFHRDYQVSRDYQLARDYQMARDYHMARDYQLTRASMTSPTLIPLTTIDNQQPMSQMNGWVFVPNYDYNCTDDPPTYEEAVRIGS